MANQPLNEQQLQALLRLKRHEQPPPGYFDELLHKVHRRQREELLRRPAWRLFFERLVAFLQSRRPDWGYVGTMAGVLLIGIGAIQWMLPVKKTDPINVHAQGPNGVPYNEYVRIPYAPQQRQIGSSDGKLRYPVKARRTGPTRFVIDTLPANYEPSQIRF